MRVVKFVILAIVAVILIMVALANAQAVTLRLLPEAMAGFMGLSWTVTLPMFVVILGAVVLGLMIGFIAEFAREHKHRAAARHERREREALQREVADIRRSRDTSATKSANSNAKGDEIIALVEDRSVPAKRAS
ncbi:lipopolysaccharide assembly LapA domain-containing protein [Palleronia sp.]|uniref:LapA family protein n=1 Tax=Palleronia sp. TaxID=1940284 RepID=UPI0035C78BF0